MIDHFTSLEKGYKSGVGRREDVLRGTRMTGVGFPQETLEEIRSSGVVAIVRGGFSPDGMLAIADALVAGGVNVLEITLNSPDALKGIRATHEHFGDEEVLVGAGTVRDPKDVDRALEAGARFLVSPGLNAASVEHARRAGVPLLPGVFTATEAQTAFDMGCRTVKLFPADALGPGYLKSLRAPLDDMDFVPTGGVGANNVATYIHAGAVAVGVGSSLVGEPDEDSEQVTERAIKLIDALNQAREETAGA